ncbi:dTMP kinase [Pusillimonas sp.]|uniref:dTMP kinase n=1 Tax=Pusillimonas sp. TaxID=3040095 RepID=UPI0037CAF6BC
MATRRGCFVTLEGLDGAGKSTHVRGLVEHLQARGLDVVCTREPGGTEMGEALRQIVLTRPMQLETETLLMFAARVEHLRTVIEPALEAGKWVVCDRFTDATYAYQGGGRGLGTQRVEALEQWVHPHIQPDRTWLFDVPLETARERLSRGRELDRFEQEGADFFERTRNAYHDRARRDPGRFRVLDSSRQIELVRAELISQAEELEQAWRDGLHGDGA